jgi:Holliday junction resolvase RusA-like endonuclease
VTALETFVVGTPKAQPRVRSMGFRSRTTGKVTSRVYDPGTADAWRGDVARAVREAMQMAGAAPLSGPVALEIALFLPRPAYHYRKDGSLKPTAPKYVTTKPDSDNFLKAIADAMNGSGAWVDDCQVASALVAKMYVTDRAKLPGALIRWWELCPTT